ncbi:putative LRR receptor-like serine/threonine-protein kinase [Senna tora]|uniref:Putative LRR receptor-like serine/threonine-protein kinase n=1 Tax=Senna tora TaxID=362788 RepID=A0A834TZ86_9FABA|nr:putative LRR receptor-like serine/threonine-protein kinase [Senna tora]
MKYIHHLTLTLVLFFFQLVHLHGVPMKKKPSLNQFTDREALLSFKSQITHDPNNSLSHWSSNSTSSHCTWYGVSCSNLGNRVQSLHLSGLRLSGILSPHLSNLSYLHSLNLSFNAFHGHIPHHLLTRLPFLTNLSLASNNLTGTLPDLHLSRLSPLQILDLSINSLTGKLPPHLGNLSSLINLSLGRNHFSGEIPPELADLRNLSHLQFFDNDLSGDFPSSILNLSSLLFLSLTNNHLTGELPGNIGHALPNLKSLFLANNAFRGVIPASISNATCLEDLDLSNNQFRGWVPLLFNNLNKLTNLNLGANRLSSTTRLNSHLFESLANSTRLQVFRIYSNQLTGELPRSVSNLSSDLQHFCVADNSLTGKIPMGMGKFQNLLSLSLEMNDFTGGIPEEIGGLNKLVQLLLYQNRLSGEIPNILGNFSQLNTLALGNNQFTGTIPASIGECKQLNFVDLRMNRLHGTIPKEIFELSGLNTLYLTDNQLWGFIPEVIGACSGLQYLGMARNNISGPIPSRLGDLRSLEVLDLSLNILSGQIPEKLEKLEYMVNLNLSFNQLEGQVPMEGVFTNLTKVDLQGNPKLCSLNHTVAHKWGILLCDNPRKRKRSLLVVPIIVAIVGATALLVTLFVLFWVSCKKKITTTSSPHGHLKGVHETISYGEIKLATNNFAAENLIGKGGFGYVYKGVFNINSTDEEEATTTTTFAVKVLDLKQSKACKSFNAECEALRIVRHRNLVKVITSCSSVDYKGNEFKALPSNVLLDQNMVAHVGDFGLARILSQNPSPNYESSTVGLKEYGVGGKAWSQGDVYNFGILLLEMMIARRPTDEMFKEGLSLTKLGSSIMDDINKVRKVCDGRLFKDYDEYSTTSSSSNNGSDGDDSVEKCIGGVIGVGLCCAAQDAKDRLNMKEVSTKLQAIRRSIYVAAL